MVIIHIHGNLMPLLLKKTLVKHGIVTRMANVIFFLISGPYQIIIVKLKCLPIRFIGICPIVGIKIKDVVVINEIIPPVGKIVLPVSLTSVLHCVYLSLRFV